MMINNAKISECDMNGAYHAKCCQNEKDIANGVGPFEAAWTKPSKPIQKLPNIPCSWNWGCSWTSNSWLFRQKRDMIIPAPWNIQYIVQTVRFSRGCSWPTACRRPWCFWWLLVILHLFLQHVVCFSPCLWAVFYNCLSFFLCYLIIVCVYLSFLFLGEEAVSPPFFGSSQTPEPVRTKRTKRPSRTASAGRPSAMSTMPQRVQFAWGKYQVKHKTWKVMESWCQQKHNSTLPKLSVSSSQMHDPIATLQNIRKTPRNTPWWNYFDAAQ